MIYKLFIFLFRRQRSTRFHGIFAVWIDGTKILWYNKRRVTIQSHLKATIIILLFWNFMLNNDL